MIGRLKRIWAFYREGFKAMVLGRLLWKIILLKLIIMIVLGRLFFPDYLRANYATDQARAAHVLNALTSQNNRP